MVRNAVCPEFGAPGGSKSRLGKAAAGAEAKVKAKIFHTVVGRSTFGIILEVESVKALQRRSTFGS
jgi:hypothetical protein